MIAYRVFVLGYGLMLIVPFCASEIRRLFKYPKGDL